MAEVANYIYGFAAVCGAVLVAFGGLIVTLSTGHLRLARGFFLASALPLFALPITFGVTGSSPAWALALAAISAFVLAMIYYIGLSILNEHLKHADKASERRVS